MKGIKKNNMKRFSYKSLEPFNFLGLDDQDYQKARAVVLPVPYTSTASWKTGTNEGPRALIEASRHVELYDIELQKNISEQDIYTMPFLEPDKDSPKKTIERIKEATTEVIKDDKFLLMIGGEHSITLGAVLALKEKYPDLSVLQIDAHTDLRDEYEGTKYSHASVMKRIRDLGISTVQVGIRSICQEEAEYIKKEKLDNVFFAPSLPLDKIISALGKNIYITFDLDGLDPSIMPSTGTPEPGGLGWYESLELIKKVAEKKNIVGADVVELDPIPGMAAPDFLAAKLAYKIINYSLTQ
jgi:agmatinase